LDGGKIIMTEKMIKKIISLIKTPDYTIMWNDGKDNYLILDNIVYDWEDETPAFFKDFKQRQHIDLKNCSIDDFIFFRKSQMTEILDEVSL
jgi:hypothetical protein